MQQQKELRGTHLNDAVLRFIRREFEADAYLLRRADVLLHFDLPEAIGTRILRTLHDSGRIVWDEYGIRPMTVEVKR
jgi:hypothetical protein